MYYKTLKSSETGKKFTEFRNRQEEVDTKAREFISKVGAERWLPASFCIAGGVRQVIFPKGYEVPKCWRLADKKYNSYAPRESVKEGNQLAAEMAALPTISIAEFHDVFNYKCSASFSHAGYATAPEHYVFTIFKEDLNSYTPPSDCVEILQSEYLKLLGK